jgi:hypothetical protein
MNAHLLQQAAHASAAIHRGVLQGYTLAIPVRAVKQGADKAQEVSV